VDTFLRVEGTVKFQSAGGSINLSWDPNYVNEPPVEAFSEDDRVRVFVARNVCMVAFQSAIDAVLDEFRALAAEPMVYLLAAMARDRVGYVYIRRDNTQPAAMQPGAATPAGFAGGSWLKMKCNYCGCTFLLGTDGRCPNCGAAVQG
jgi:hypothetical protein